LDETLTRLALNNFGTNGKNEIIWPKTFNGDKCRNPGKRPPGLLETLRTLPYPPQNWGLIEVVDPLKGLIQKGRPSLRKN